MKMNDLRVSFVALAGGGLLVLAGCSDESSDPTGPVFPNVSTPELAVQALEDAYGFQVLDDALYLLTDDFVFNADPSAEISFLPTGTSSWDLGRETKILERMLVPERVSWLDQVLLEFDIQTIDIGRGGGTTVVTGKADLFLTRGASDLLSGTSDLELVYQVDGEGNHFLREMNETPVEGFETLVSELKSFVGDPPTVETRDVEEVTSTQAVLRALVNANTLATTYSFAYGTDSTGVLLGTPVQDGGDGFVPVGRDETVTGLTPNTEYFFQVVATNDWGTSASEFNSFTTTP